MLFFDYYLILGCFADHFKETEHWCPALQSLGYFLQNEDFYFDLSALSTFILLWRIWNASFCPKKLKNSELWIFTKILWLYYHSNNWLTIALTHAFKQHIPSEPVAVLGSFNATNSRWWVLLGFLCTWLSQQVDQLTAACRGGEYNITFHCNALFILYSS